MTMTLLTSSATATALAATNSINAATAGSTKTQASMLSKQATAPHLVEGKQIHHIDGIKQDQTTADLTNSAPSSIVKKRSTAVMKPDIGILSKVFLKSKGKETVDKKFAIHRKQAAAVDVDVGILSNGMRQQASRANLHAMNEVTGRSLQSEEYLPDMCPGKNGGGGLAYFDNLFDETDGYFPKCSCPSPTTCGPSLCECLELDADGDIFQCMDPFNQLCEGTMYIDGIPGPWSMEECLGIKIRAIQYCSMLPCFVDGGSFTECKCQSFDSYCTEYRYTLPCAISKCCQAQTDDKGREACVSWDAKLWENYYDQVTSFSISYEEMISRFNECSFQSDSGKSIVECYCESFTYRHCVNFGIASPVYCEAMHCCYEQTEDDARLDCFTTRYTVGRTGYYFYNNRDGIRRSCVASGRSSDQCKCDIQGLSDCVFGIDFFSREPRCDLFQCCKSQTDDNDEGRKDCLVQDEAQLMYIECINDGNSTDSCVCDKSNSLCSSGHSNNQHCELSSCCQEQADDTGRKECIGNFTTSQPSSAPSESVAGESIPEVDASPTAASALPGTSSASIPTPFGAKSLAKTRIMTVVAITVWLLLT